MINKFHGAAEILLFMRRALLACVSIACRLHFRSLFLSRTAVSLRTFAYGRFITPPINKQSDACSISWSSRTYRPFLDAATRSLARVYFAVACRQAALRIRSAYAGP